MSCAAGDDDDAADTDGLPNEADGSAGGIDVDVDDDNDDGGTALLSDGTGRTGATAAARYGSLVGGVRSGCGRERTVLETSPGDNARAVACVVRWAVARSVTGATS
jgi:hypothetical protein